MQFNATASSDQTPDALLTNARDRLALIVDSYQRLTGRPLVADGVDVASALWQLPQVVLAHGTEPDPVFFYANRLALEVFELTPSQLMEMPSRLSAEALLREERARLLDRVSRDGFIDDYSGIRISSTGQRFRIQQATVWNLIDSDGSHHGQAATFSRWEFL